MGTLFVLTLAGSNRLIGKAAAEMDEVKGAKKEARVLAGRGSTTLFAAEEIPGKGKFSALMNRNSYLSGLVVQEIICTFLGKEKPPISVRNRGVIEPPVPIERVPKMISRHS